MVGQNPGNKDIYIYVERHPNNMIFFFYVYNLKTRTGLQHPITTQWRKVSKHYNAVLQAAWSWPAVLELQAHNKGVIRCWKQEEWGQMV